MITRERLEELIKQEAIIYYVLDDCITNFILNKKYKFTVDKDTLFQNEDYSCCIKNFYETKEEAEFVAKNHDTRIEKFEPPFELKEYENYEFISQNYDVGVCHIIHLNGYHVCNYDNYVYKFFDTYQEAVDYAHKLFKGEE